MMRAMPQKRQTSLIRLLPPSRRLAVLLVWLLFSGLALAQPMPRCVYVASYTPGYVWQDGIEHGLRHNLVGQCELHTFYMDTKNLKEESYRQARGEAARDFIERIDPDVVIVSDDNAVRYVLQPHYRNHKRPFVFCGVNDTALGYGLPYRNTTGMIERKEISDLLYLIHRAAPGIKRMAFLGTPTVTAQKNAQAFAKSPDLAEALQVHWVSSLDQWQAQFLALQQDDSVDAVILGNMISLIQNDPELQGLKSLQTNALPKWVAEHTRKLSVTVYEWMMPYAALGVVNSAEEQGEWAALSALAILEGLPPNRIPVVANQRFQFALNPLIWDKLHLNLPISLQSNIATSGWSQ